MVRSSGSYGFSLCGSEPVYIESVLECGPAQRAGLTPGDSIMRVNGTDVRLAELLR